MKTAQQKALSRDRLTPKKKSIMRDDSDPEDEDDDEDADADVLEEAPSTSALEEEEDDDATINAGLHNVSNTCYLNATVQVMYLCFFLSSNRYRFEMFLDPTPDEMCRDDDDDVSNDVSVGRAFGFLSSAVLL